MEKYTCELQNMVSFESGSEFPVLVHRLDGPLKLVAK